MISDNPPSKRFLAFIEKDVNSLSSDINAKVIYKLMTANSPAINSPVILFLKIICKIKTAAIPIDNGLNKNGGV